MAIAQSRRMHGAMASGEPVIVTALSVELGNISLATWIDAPVDYNRQQLPFTTLAFHTRRSVNNNSTNS